MKLHKIFLWVVLLIPCRFGDRLLFNELVLPIVGAWLLIELIVRNIFFTTWIYILILVTIFYFLIFSFTEDSLTTIKDYAEMCKPVVFFGLYQVGKNIKFEEKMWRNILIFSIVFSALVLLPFMHPLIEPWKASSRFGYRFVHFLRWSGTMGYPGMFGYSVLLAIFYLKERGRYKYLPLLLGVLLMTFSRGSILMALASFIMSEIIFYRRLNYIFGLSIVIGGVWIFILPNDLGYLTEGINKLSESSANHRLNEMSLIWHDISHNLLVGRGPNNVWYSANHPVIENVYYYYGTKFGILGILGYASFGIYIARRSILHQSEILLLAAFLWFIGSLNESVSEEYKFFVFFFMFLGQIVSQYESKHIIE